MNEGNVCNIRIPLSISERNISERNGLSLSLSSRSHILFVSLTKHWIFAMKTTSTTNHRVGTSKFTEVSDNQNKQTLLLSSQPQHQQQHYCKLDDLSISWYLPIWLAEERQAGTSLTRHCYSLTDAVCSLQSSLARHQWQVVVRFPFGRSYRHLAAR